MPQDPSEADELYGLRTQLILEHGDCSRRVEEAEEKMQEIERKLGNKNLLVQYGWLMFGVETNEDAMKNKKRHINYLDEKIAKFNIPIKEEKATRNSAESAEAQQSYAPRHSAELIGLPPRGNREGAGHRVQDANSQLAYAPNQSAGSSEQPPRRNRKRTGHTTV